MTAVDAGAVAGLRVTYAEETYPAEPVPGGAAFLIGSPEPRPGFFPSTAGPGAPAYQRFVHASEVSSVLGVAEAPEDVPLQAPLGRAITWEVVHRLCQGRTNGAEHVVAGIHASAAIRRGTRMVKALSAQQVAGYLRGWQPRGFCYRSYDVAHLRTPRDLSILRGDGAADELTGIAYALRWRATDPSDYASPTVLTGLTRMPSHDRLGPPVLPTGFAPSAERIIPEFITHDLADLPLPTNAALLAYTDEGVEVMLYFYKPEQRGWLRMVGPQWIHLLRPIPDVARDQEYVPTGRDAGNGTSRLIGLYRGEEYVALADPPNDFRVLAMTRAAQYPVDRLARRTRYARWRGADCTLVREDGGWCRIRLCRPDPDNVATLGAQCVERGVYETWAPAGELIERRDVDVEYPI